MLGNGFTIESIDPKTIEENDLKKIAEIEQDMWAREDGIGEYVKCTNCNHIDSKEDIFGNISKEIKILTVGKIEETLSIEKINCTKCNSVSNAIYDRNEYIEEIRDRYSNSIESFLTVYRDGIGEIRGFFDGYLDTFENIYDREFSGYYKNIGINKLTSIIEKTLGYDLPKNIFIFSSVGMEKSYINFIVYLNLLKGLFNSIGDDKNNFLGITDVTIGTNIAGLYKSLGAIPLGNNNNKQLLDSFTNKNKKVSSDIYIHEGVVSDYKREFSIPIKSFLLKYRNLIR